jgi:hypothetical protein
MATSTPPTVPPTEEASAAFGSSCEDDVDYAQVAVILAGSYYVLNGINDTIRNLYRHACFQSDPRLVILGIRPDNKTTKVWNWAARVLELTWLPLWFEFQRIRDAAVNQAVDNASMMNRFLRALGRPPNDSDTSTLGGYEDDSDKENRQDWRGAMGQRQPLG